jgi:hypothetical protein
MLQVSSQSTTHTEGFQSRPPVISASIAYGSFAAELLLNPEQLKREEVKKSSNRV